MQHSSLYLFYREWHLSFLWLQVGHAGTLDPMATGLLIICTGRGTKQIDDFVAMEKAYTGTLRLGQATPSYDAMSEIEEEVPWDHITGEQTDSAACFGAVSLLVALQVLICRCLYGVIISQQLVHRYQLKVHNSFAVALYESQEPSSPHYVPVCKC